MAKVVKGSLFLTCGIFAYLPTLPDPYMTNLNVLKSQFGRATAIDDKKSGGQAIRAWLVSRTGWAPGQDTDKVDVSFHFAPINNQFLILGQSGSQPTPVTGVTANAGQQEPMVKSMMQEVTPAEKIEALLKDDFALLDVSSNADQMGVS